MYCRTFYNGDASAVVSVLVGTGGAMYCRTVYSGDASAVLSVPH